MTLPTKPNSCGFGIVTPWPSVLDLTPSKSGSSTSFRRCKWIYYWCPRVILLSLLQSIASRKLVTVLEETVEHHCCWSLNSTECSTDSTPTGLKHSQSWLEDVASPVFLLPPVNPSMTALLSAPVMINYENAAPEDACLNMFLKIPMLIIHSTVCIMPTYLLMSPTIYCNSLKTTSFFPTNISLFPWHKPPNF